MSLADYTLLTRTASSGGAFQAYRRPLYFSLCRRSRACDSGSPRWKHSRYEVLVMIPLVTFALVVLGVGLTLVVMGLGNRKTAAPADAETAAPPARRTRPVLLTLGLLIAAAGGIGAAVLLTRDPEGLDRWVLERWPADWLIDDLNSEDAQSRSQASHELWRRHEAGLLSDDAQRRLVARKIAFILKDPKLPEAPSVNAPILDVDLVDARRRDLLSAKQWGEFIARASPLRLDVPRTVPSGQQIPLRLDASLMDHTSPAWVIIKVESLTIGGKAVDLPPPVAIAANPDWTAPPPVEPADGEGAPQVQAAGGGGPRPPVLRRVVRYPYAVPAEFVAALGEGSFPVVGKVTVLAFDSEEVAPPIELMNDAATGVPRRQRASEDLVAVALSAQLTPEQFEQFRSRAQASHSWDIKRDIRVGNPPATQPATRTQAEEPAEEQGETGGIQ